MLILVTRQPVLDGQQLELQYYRELNEQGEEVARHPVAYRLLPSGDWINNPSLVEAVMHPLFERDGLMSLVWPVLQAILPAEVSLQRLDVRGALVVGIGGWDLTEEEVEGYGALIAEALYSQFAGELNTGRLAVVWGR